MRFSRARIIKCHGVLIKCSFMGACFQDGRAALHFAAAHSKDDMMKLLLSRKADVTVTGGVSHTVPGRLVDT